MAQHPDYTKWKELASKELRGKPADSLNWKTPEGIVVKPLYTAEDLETLEHLNSLPGMWVASHVKVGTSHAMVVLLLFFAIGMMVAPVVIGIALGLGVHWRWVFGFEAIVSAVLALWLMVTPISDIPNRENLPFRQLRAVIGFNPALFATVLVVAILYIGAEFTFNVFGRRPHAPDGAIVD